MDQRVICGANARSVIMAAGEGGGGDLGPGRWRRRRILSGLGRLLSAAAAAPLGAAWVAHHEEEDRVEELSEGGGIERLVRQGAKP